MGLSVYWNRLHNIPRVSRYNHVQLNLEAKEYHMQKERPKDHIVETSSHDTRRNEANGKTKTGYS